MNSKDYMVEVHLNQMAIICIKVREENAELALNKAQGMLHNIEGWIHLEDDLHNKYRIKNDRVSYLVVREMGN